MVIQPKFRGFICTTAHPVGCAKNVQEQINYVRNQKPFTGAKNALIIGASTGYGLASRIAAAFGSGAATLGIFFERPATENRTATAGWYNTAAFENEAKRAGLYAKSLNGDAFSNELKEQAIEVIRKDLGKIDLLVYSLASPRRTHPVTGEVLSSVIKPIGKPFTNKTVDFHTQKVTQITVEPATEDEIRQTVGVMGGEDWLLWIRALKQAGVLAENVKTVAYSYIGPKITHPIYKDGTIGRAKDDLENTVMKINHYLEDIGGKAYVSVNKAVVTQASSAIPVVPLYISLLFKVMKEKNIHEGCIEQMYRLFGDRLYGDLKLDENNRIRVDDYEMRDDVQEEILRLWNAVTTENIAELSDISGYREDFFRMFGFGLQGIDYEKDVDIMVPIPSLE